MICDGGVFEETNVRPEWHWNWTRIQEIKSVVLPLELLSLNCTCRLCYDTAYSLRLLPNFYSKLSLTTSGYIFFRNVGYHLHAIIIVVITVTILIVVESKSQEIRLFVVGNKWFFLIEKTENLTTDVPHLLVPRKSATDKYRRPTTCSFPHAKASITP